MQALASGHNVQVVARLVVRMCEYAPVQGHTAAVILNKAIATRRFTNARALSAVAQINELTALYAAAQRGNAPPFRSDN